MFAVAIWAFVTELRQQIESKVELLTGYYIEYDGTCEKLQSAKTRLAIVVPLVLLLIFGLVFTCSARQKTPIPWFSDAPLSISAGAGYIALLGVAVFTRMMILVKKLLYPVAVRT